MCANFGCEFFSGSHHAMQLSYYTVSPGAFSTCACHGWLWACVFALNLRSICEKYHHQRINIYTQSWLSHHPGFALAARTHESSSLSGRCKHPCSVPMCGIYFHKVKTDLEVDCACTRLFSPTSLSQLQQLDVNAPKAIKFNWECTVIYQRKVLELISCARMQSNSLVGARHSANTSSTNVQVCSQWSCCCDGYSKFTGYMLMSRSLSAWWWIPKQRRLDKKVPMRLPLTVGLESKGMDWSLSSLLLPRCFLCCQRLRAACSPLPIHIARGANLNLFLSAQILILRVTHFYTLL